MARFVHIIPEGKSIYILFFFYFNEIHLVADKRRGLNNGWLNGWTYTNGQTNDLIRMQRRGALIRKDRLTNLCELWTEGRNVYTNWPTGEALRINIRTNLYEWTDEYANRQTFTNVQTNERTYETQRTDELTATNGQTD